MEKYIYRGKLDRVVDGDTIDALIDVGFDIWLKKRVRFHGMDAWESRTRDLEEKARGLASKDRLVELLEDGEFILESKEVGKYGRVLGTLHVDDINVNETLVQEGFAVEYWGGTKKKK